MLKREDLKYLRVQKVTNFKWFLGEVVWLLETIGEENKVNTEIPLSPESLKIYCISPIREGNLGHFFWMLGQNCSQ